MEQPDDIFHKKEYSSGKKFFVFLICLFIAFFIWVFSQNKQEYQKQYTFSLKYQNLPIQLIMTAASDSNINVTVNSDYWFFNTTSIDKFNLPVDIGKLKFVKKNGYFECVFYTNQLIPFIKDKLPSNVQITNFSPRFIVFRFVDYVYKEVPVKYDEVHTYAPQYALASPIIYHTKMVMLEGNNEVLKKINYVKTLPVRLYNIKHNQSIDVAIDTISFGNQVRVSLAKVKISFNVEPFTECIYNVPVDVLCKGIEKRKIKIFPSTVQIYAEVPLSKAKNLRKEHFKAQVSFSVSQTNSILPVKILNCPQLITIKKVEPAFLEYLILEK